MELAAAEPYATYVTFNKGEVFIPPEIAEKSIGIDGDIGAAINAIVEMWGNEFTGISFSTGRVAQNL